MQVTETLSDRLKRAYTVVLPGTEIESRRAKRLADLGRTLTLPGFRPGKVPLPVVRSRFGPAVAAEVMEESVQEAVQRVLNERGVRPALQPKVDLTNAEGAGTPGGPAQDLEFKLEVEVLPDIPVPEFASLALTRLKTDVSDETLGRALANLAERNRSFADISPEELGERGAETGEFAVVDYLGRANGVEFPGGKGTDVPVEIGGEGFIPGFAAQLAGIRPGETRTFPVTFPQDYGAAELAGREAEFEVTAKGIRRATLPEVNDAFAETLSFDSLDELKDFMRKQIQREYDSLSRQRLKRELLDQLNRMVRFELPEGLVETEFSQIWARIEADRRAGTLDDDDKAKDDETLRDEYRKIAERRVRLGLLLAEIGRLNEITVTSDEMARAMRAEAARYPGQESKILEFFQKNPRATETLRGPIFEEKVVDFLAGRAQVAERQVSPEELARDPEETDSAPDAPALGSSGEATGVSGE